MLQDAIERQVTVRAPRQKVFAAITDPTKIIAWFPDAVEGKLDEGESPILDFGEGRRNRIHVEAVRPHDYFAYRWVPGQCDGAGFLGDVLATVNTLVEFRLEDSSEGTIVKVKESGFASLPSEVGETAFSRNSGGWDYMLDRLVNLL